MTQKLFALNSFLSAEEGKDPETHTEEEHLVDYITAFWNLDRLNKAEVKIQIEIAYWNKAFQIHNWFYKHGLKINSPNSCSITSWNISKLLLSCKTVLESPVQADNLLPLDQHYSPNGYDREYFQQLRDTILQLERILNEPLWKEKGWFFSYSFIY